MKLRLEISRCLSLALALAVLLVATNGFAGAQAEPTAVGTGSRWLVGGTYSYFQADYGKRYLGGGSGFVDYARSPRVSYEAEVRFLTMNEQVGTHQSTYLIGAKFPYYTHWATPYARFLSVKGVSTSPMATLTEAILFWPPALASIYLSEEAASAYG